MSQIGIKMNISEVNQLKNAYIGRYARFLVFKGSYTCPILKWKYRGKD
jgi:hypothetical protein